MAYRESLSGKINMKCRECGEGVGKFRDMVMECNNDVCGMIRVGGQRRKMSEWWNEEVGGAVAEKRCAFEEWHRYL